MDTTLAAALAALIVAPAAAQVKFADATAELGLDGLSAARVALADLNGDGRSDAVIDRHRVFLNVEDEASPRGFAFREIESGLPKPGVGDSVVFADLDNDGKADAVIARYLDVNNEKFEPPAEGPERTAWLPGNGDGTFGEPREIPAAKEATTAAVAVGDVDRNGLLDLFLGNWYVKYGESLEGFTNDLLMQVPPGQVHRTSGPSAFVRHWLAEDDETFDEERDAAGRPTYGVMIASLLPPIPYAKPGGMEPGIVYPGFEKGEPPPPPDPRPQLIELNYGRRWNRLLSADGRDMAPHLWFDGDGIRHGRYPEWLRERAKTDPRFDRPDEKPFRANGNTFDAAVGDIDNDGRFDLFVAEITHAWAGESSDRSRFLVAKWPVKDVRPRFVSPPELSVDRIPPPSADGEPVSWNQGDLFCELADLDHDGRLDLILSSGDYPDPAPFDQRLRVFHQQRDGTFEDVTPASGIDHVGSQQISLGDVDLDGDLDILVGQTFNRFTPEMKEAAGGTPRVRVFLNRGDEATERRGDEGGGKGKSITLKLVGDPERGINRDALGAVVRCTATIGGESVVQSRQLIGIGGHAGKQHEFLVHFGLGDAERAERIEIEWPAATRSVTVLTAVEAGRHEVRPGAVEPAAGE